MAPLPVNSTARLFVDYTTCGEDHTVMCRFGASSSAGDAMTVVAAWLDALESLLYDIDILGARVSDLGSSVSYPVTWTGAAAYGSGAGANTDSASYLDFVGRGIGGRRARMAVFGSKNYRDGANDDFRITPADAAAIGDALTALRAGSDVPITIDGDDVNWQDYANVGVNAYWRNHMR